MNLVTGWWRTCVLCAAATLAWSDIATAQSLTLVWDRSPDPAVAGYIVYAGTQSGDYSASFNVGTNTSFLYEAVPGQMYFFVVASYAAGMIVGPPSAEISGFALAAPSVPDASEPGDLVSADVTAPIITITQPSAADRLAVLDQYVLVGGVAIDDAGVAAVTWSNSRGPSGTATGTDFWIASIPLLPGRNDITVTAIDRAGNRAAATVSVQRHSLSP